MFSEGTPKMVIRRQGPLTNAGQFILSEDKGQKDMLVKFDAR